MERIGGLSGQDLGTSRIKLENGKCWLGVPLTSLALGPGPLSGRIQVALTNWSVAIGVGQITPTQLERGLPERAN